MNLYAFIYFYRFFPYQVSGRFSYENLVNPKVNKAKNLVETWGKVLVTSGYTDYAKNPGKSSPKKCQKILQYFFRPQSARKLQHLHEQFLNVYSGAAAEQV